MEEKERERERERVEERERGRGMFELYTLWMINSKEFVGLFACFQ